MHLNFGVTSAGTPCILNGCIKDETALKSVKIVQIGSGVLRRLAVEVKRNSPVSGSQNTLCGTRCTADVRVSPPGDGDDGANRPTSAAE